MGFFVLVTLLFVLLTLDKIGPWLLWNDWPILHEKENNAPNPTRDHKTKEAHSVATHQYKEVLLFDFSRNHEIFVGFWPMEVRHESDFSQPVGKRYSDFHSSTSSLVGDRGQLPLDVTSPSPQKYNFLWNKNPVPRFRCIDKDGTSVCASSDRMPLRISCNITVFFFPSVQSALTCTADHGSRYTHIFAEKFSLECRSARGDLVLFYRDHGEDSNIDQWRLTNPEFRFSNVQSSDTNVSTVSFDGHSYFSDLYALGRDTMECRIHFHLTNIYEDYKACGAVVVSLFMLYMLWSLVHYVMPQQQPAAVQKKRDEVIRKMLNEWEEAISEEEICRNLGMRDISGGEKGLTVDELLYSQNFRTYCSAREKNENWTDICTHESKEGMIKKYEHGQTTTIPLNDHTYPVDDIIGNL